MSPPSPKENASPKISDAQVKSEKNSNAASPKEKLKNLIPYWLAFTASTDRDIEKQTRVPRIALLTTAIVLVVFFGWAYFAELDQVTRASGKVIVSSKSQVVQSLDGGVLDVLLVKEGESVQAQQVLAQLDRTKLEASFLEAKAKVVALQINLHRMNAEMQDKPFAPLHLFKDYPEFHSNQIALIEKRRLALKEEIFALTNMLELAQKELEMNRPLLDRGDISQVDLLRIQRQVLELKAQITNRKNKYQQDTQTELSRAQEELSAAEQVLLQRKDQLDRSILKAPMSGIVKDIRITTIGGVLRPGEELMQIVPVNDDLIVEARVSPTDIGFLKVGLPASVKIDTYDYTIYGSLRGEIKYISADTVREEVRQNEPDPFKVQVRVNRHDLKPKGNQPIEIHPGMSATVEFNTGKNTVLWYLTKPLVKTVSNSLKER
jgi:adhesin transport system membrane fusion protein